MELLNPLALSAAESASPALNRGLALLLILGNRAPLSLETLAGELDLPKSSVFRLLGTLEAIGLIRKLPDRTYEPLWRLQPLEDPKLFFRRRIEKKLNELCTLSDCTAEWYEPVEEGMKLICQMHPECELRVQAKPGYIRHWGGELDAVAQLGYAFVPAAPLLTESVWGYVSNGVAKQLPRQRAQELVTNAQQEKSAFDLHFNSNGVRRAAVAAFSGEFFHGVLALAEAFHFKRSRKPTQLIHLLTSTLQTP